MYDGGSQQAARLTSAVRDFMEEEVLPSEELYWQQIEDSGDPFHQPAVMADLRGKAKAADLWNLFLPESQRDLGGHGLSNFEYAAMCEQMGRSLIGAEAFNCHPPESGNIGLLADVASPEQREQWLDPLVEGTISSCFSMTEPDVASSDANNIRTRIERDGDDYVINGRKGPSAGAARETCRLSILVGVTDPDGHPARRQSLVLVPLDSPGVSMRHFTIFGQAQPLSLTEITFDDVRIPAGAMLQEPGDGFSISQARLGPGRIHHCMRAIGMAERALELMCHRVVGRATFGTRLADHGVVQDWIARSRMEIEQARLLTLKAAQMMDDVGAKAARQEIAAIKIVAPATAIDVLDRAIQSFGWAGVTEQTPLARMWTSARTLRILDGPDEVHVRSLARSELKLQVGS